MKRTERASVEVSLEWQSPHARHCDRRHFAELNFWRDFFPGDLAERLAGREAGAQASVALVPGEGLPAYSRARRRRIRHADLRLPEFDGEILVARVGRFYPQRWLAGAAGGYAQPRAPLRCLAVDSEGLEVDLNHPLAGRELKLHARVTARLPAREEHGGLCRDVLLESADGGPGMQSSLAGRDTDFFSGQPYRRDDDGPDARFYATPRLVHHLDAHARGELAALHGRFLEPGMEVLDLMSSWTSHLPADCADLAVTGLGLNADELNANSRLSARCVHDLNADCLLPFTDRRFDAVLCSLSVEYLTRPARVFEEVARVLRPGARFVVSFSERWFPGKVTRLWRELHAFERLGLVVEHFRRAGFVDIVTESLRGLPRPALDKYAGRLRYADPIYAVWGTARLDYARRLPSLDW